MDFYNTKLNVPETGTSNGTFNIACFKQSDLNKIANVCTPAAGGSEFQIHYRALQICLTKGIKRVVITLPTTYFNFPQDVTVGSVDYLLDDIKSIADNEEVKKLDMNIIKKIANDFNNIIKESDFQNLEVTFITGEMGSIHRHPGEFGFSSIDLDNSTTNPGIIFRNKKCEDRIQTDSIIYIGSGQKIKIVTTETRLVTVEPEDKLRNGGLTGYYLKSPTATYILNDEESSSISYEEDSKNKVSIPHEHEIKDFTFSQFFDNGKTFEIQPEEVIEGTDEFCGKTLLVDDIKLEEVPQELLSIIDTFFIEFNYAPLQLINPDFIKERKYNFSSYGVMSASNKKKTKKDSKQAYFEDLEKEKGEDPFWDY